MRTRSTSAEANEVLRRFFGNGPKIEPGPSPSGWVCGQRQGDGL
jgi:hypothetical protein